jgi:mono/diheme cytochrome c family protein
MRFPFRNARTIVCAAAGLIVGFRVTSSWAFPWSTDMYRGPAVQPLSESPRVMPQGTLPVDGESPIPRNRAGELLHDPLRPTPAHLAHGRQLYESYCAVCHGPTGHGDGSVARMFAGDYPVTDLVKDTVYESDGYVYGTIRYGGLVMPPLGDTMSPEERWEVVLFVRQLEGKLPNQRGNR